MKARRTFTKEFKLSIIQDSKSWRSLYQWLWNIWRCT